MKFAPQFREALTMARLRCGNIIAVTVEAMGYTIVPTNLVETFCKMLERDDAKNPGS